MRLKEVLARHGVEPDKRLGQHFLVSERTVGRIVAGLSGCAGVLEVGPGPGALTGPLCEAGHEVLALELDPTMLPVLAETAPKAKVVLGDALRVDLGPLVQGLKPPRGLVSNMPYNVTGPLLEAFTAVRDRYATAILMMQREVGEKILAPPGDSARGALSVAMQASFTIDKLDLVPPGAFFPPPKVESMVLKLVPKDAPAGLEETLRLVRTGFRQPRKTLANNLVPLLGREGASARIANIGLSPTVRPHELTWDQWTKLAG